MGAFLSNMEEEREEIVSMNQLHADALLLVCKLKKIYLESELAQYQKVLMYATSEMSSFEVLLTEIENIVDEIKAYEQEIKNIIEWRR